MDKAYIDEKHVIERYLQGKLAEDELSAFEIYMLDHPEIVDDVEYARGMQDALIGVKDELYANTPSPTLTQPPSGFWLGRQYALAATVLFAITLTISGLLYQRIGGLNDEIAELRRPVAVTDEIWLEPVRGGRERIVERSEGTALVLRVDVGAASADSYTAELRGEGTDFFWERSQIRPDDERSIRFVVSGLPSGNYRLAVSADDGVTAPFAEYRFLLQEPQD